MITPTPSLHPIRSTWSRLRLPVTALAMAASLAVVSTTPQTAKADHPVAVAAIGAGAVLGAAAITGAAVLGAAVIAGAATVASAAISSSSGGGGEEVPGEGGGEGGDGGGEPRSAGFEVSSIAAAMAKQGCVPHFPSTSLAGPGSKSVSAVPKKFSAFVKRSFGAAITKDAAKGLAAEAKFSFDGDVMKSPAGCAYVGNDETLTWELDLKKNPTAKDDYFVLHMDRLDLTTTEVPGTEGHSEMTLTAYQDGAEIWSWKGVAHQGKASVHGAIPKGAKLTKRKGELHIEDFWTTIPFELAKGETKAKVRIVARYRGKGERL